MRDLQHLLLAWELLGEPRRAAFTQAAAQVLSDVEWQALDDAFCKNNDPLSGKYPRDPVYDRLFTRIVMKAPVPIGLGG